MKFFNPKEDVLDIKLTNYGRQALSKGRWKPAYYSFMDENVLYDSEYGGFTEPKSNAEVRIQEETPLLRTQMNFADREQFLFDDTAATIEQLHLNTYEKLNVMPFSLGNSSPDSTKTPAIRIQCLQGEIKDLEFNLTGSTRTEKIANGVVTKSHQLLKIPQIEMDVEYKITVAESKTSELKFTPDPALTPGNFYADGNVVLVGPEQILFVIDEANAPFEFENFDIEVYEMRDEFDVFGEQIKNQLSFIKPLQMVENNILIDKEEAEVKAGRLNGAIPDVDPTYVNYFFDVNVDSEVDEKIICSSVNQLARNGKSLFTDVEINCPDLDPVFIAPVYASDAIDEDCPDY